MYVVCDIGTYLLNFQLLLHECNLCVINKLKFLLPYFYVHDHAPLFTSCDRMESKLFMGIEISTQQVFADSFCGIR